MSLPPLSPVIVIQCLGLDRGLTTLGRSLLQSFIVDYIITKHPQADLDRVSQKAISEAKLASISEDLKITQLKTLPITRDKCDILLAFIGAIYKEMGFDKLKEWLNDVISPHISAIVEYEDTQLSQPDIKPVWEDLEPHVAMTEAEAAKSSHQEQDRSKSAYSNRDDATTKDVMMEESDTSHEVDSHNETSSAPSHHARNGSMSRSNEYRAEALRKLEIYKKQQALQAKEREEELKEKLNLANAKKDKEEELAAKSSQSDEQSRKRKRDHEAGPPLKNLRWQSSYSTVARVEFVKWLIKEGNYREERPMSKYNLDHGKVLPIPEELTVNVQPDLPSSYPPPLPALNETSLFEVLTHRSLNPPLNVMQDPEGYTSFDNERLEFLGDAVLEVHTTEAIFVQHPQLRPGGMVSLRNRLVNGSILAYFAELYDLPSKLRMSSQFRKQDSQPNHSTKTKADVMEAYIGAVFRDREAGISRTWLIELLEPFVKCHLTVVQKEFEERNRGEVQGHWSTAINKIFGGKLNWEFGETDRNLDGVASWYAILNIDGKKIAEASSSSKKNARFTIAAMIAEYLKVPDAAGNFIPEGFTENVKHGYLYTEALDALDCVENLPKKT